MPATITQKTAKKHLVQTASAWPLVDASWTTQTSLICTGAKDGYCNEIGSASLRRPLGRVIEPGATAGTDRTPLAVNGHYVRILIADAFGPITVSSVTYSAVWYGVITSRATSMAKTGAEETFACAGLAFILDQLQLKSGYIEIAIGGKSTAWPADNLNTLPKGDRSLDGYVVGGKTINVIARDSSTVARFRWRALDALYYVLAGVVDQYPGGPGWGVSGQVGTDPGALAAPSTIADAKALQYDDEFSLEGTVLEVLSRIINPRRGAGFRVIVRDNGLGSYEAAIDVHSNLFTDLGAISGTVNDNPQAVDLADNAIINWNFTEDTSATYDWIAIEAQHERYSATLSYASSGTVDLEKGWDSSVEAAWESSSDDDDDTGVYAPVWKRFVLKPTWQGLSYQRAVGSSTSEDGTWDGGAFVYGPDGNAYTLTPTLPMFEGTDYTVVPAGAFVIDTSKPEVRPQVYLKTGSTYELLANALDEAVSMSFGENAAAVTLGISRDAALTLKDLVTDGGTLYFTVGIQHPGRIRVAAQAASPVRTMSRGIILAAPEVRRWKMLPSTILNLHESAAVYGYTGVPVIDETAELSYRLSAAYLHYGRVGGDLSWTKAGEIDFGATLAPGTLVTTASLPLDRAGAVTAKNVYAIITSRSWSFDADSYSTSYSTQRLSEDQRAVK